MLGSKYFAFARKESISQLLSFINIKKYWGCKLRIGVAKFNIGGATATSKQYKVSPLHTAYLWIRAY